MNTVVSQIDEPHRAVGRSRARHCPIACAIGALFACTALAADWPAWRGPGQTGASAENGPVTDWSPDGKNLIWKSPEGGRTTPIVMDGRVFFIGPVGDDTCLQERVICLDAANGKPLWERRFNVNFTEIAANRVGWTALVGDPESGQLYAHTTGGELLCYSRDGEVRWQRSLAQEFNRVSGYGGRLMTPMIDEDRVVISFLNSNWGDHARPTHRYLALDKRSGHVVWWSEPAGPPLDTTYANPVVATIEGKRLLIAPAGDGWVYGLLARTGQPVWKFALSKMGLNTTPVVDGKYAYVTHSEENLDTTVMGRLVCIDAGLSGDITKTGEVWRLDGLDAGYCSPALANGRLYVVDNSANLYCVNARSGKKLWEQNLGRVGKGSPLVSANGLIYVGEQNGIFYILKDAGDRAEVLSKHEFPARADGIDELFGSPALSNGRIFFMTRYGSYCLGSTDAPAGPKPPAADPSFVAEGGEAASLLLEPADVTLRPGERIVFKLNAFDAAGNKAREFNLPTSKETLDGMVNVQGPGLAKRMVKLEDGSLEFTAPKEGGFRAGLLEYAAGPLKAKARVRICPSLPIREDFDKMPDGASPPGWVGVAGKTKVVERDGSNVLCKLAEKGKPSPVWKMRAYAGPPIAGGYTVQADLLGTAARKRFRPDMGIINSGYELILMGMVKQLELSRWRDEPQHALRKKVPMELIPDRWYRVKLSVVMRKGAALVRGKLWPRDEKEPAEWTIAFDDPCPNREGAPGLFVYSNGTTDKSDGTEVFIDNFRVEANK